tara:strand:+ start:351 stop:593 length:243 start_codon:yes stop_codon:yes gene_type:complete
MLTPSLLLYYGKRRFIERINAANLTEYFTKSGTLRGKYGWQNITDTYTFHEFILLNIKELSDLNVLFWCPCPHCSNIDNK